MIEQSASTSLRKILSWVTILVIVVALVVATALVLLTTLIHRTSASLAAGVESVRLAQEIEIDLLLHSRSNDQLAREDLAGDLAGKLAEALDADVPLTQCDALRIEQAVTNLISNAVKYSPGGGTVRVGVTSAHGEIVISVGDSGLGMNEADKRRIFDPFTRIGLSQDSIPGAGLGLYIVRKIVLAHAGRIEVDSQPGHGSTFRLHLPISVAGPGP